MYACQKAAKRKFSSCNYKGKWTRDEEIVLVELQKVHHNAWTIIAKELDRTPENCRDKFREIGGSDPEKRKKGKWSLDEKLELISVINRSVNSPFCSREVACEYNNANSIVFKKNLDNKKQKLLEKGFKKKAD